MFRRIQKGFTLIELAIVLLIMAILAMMSIEPMMFFFDKAKESTVKSNMKIIQNAIELHATRLAGGDASTVLFDSTTGLPSGIVGSSYPINPFTNEATNVYWNQAVYCNTATPGNIYVISDASLNGTIYGCGRYQLLTLTLPIGAGI